MRDLLQLCFIPAEGVACYSTGTSTGGILATFLASKGADIKDHTKTTIYKDLHALLDKLPEEAGGRTAHHWRHKYTKDVVHRGELTTQLVFVLHSSAMLRSHWIAINVAEGAVLVSIFIRL